MKYVTFSLLLSLYSSHVFAWSSLGEADVQIREGNVCFTIPDKEFDRLKGPLSVVSYIIIGEKREHGRDYVPLWRFYPDKRISLSKGECLQYGKFPEGIEFDPRIGVEFPREAPALKANVVYGLDLNAINTGGPTHGYGTVFCLIEDKNGDLAVKKVRQSCDE
jgi:hypothetical protein